MNFKNAKRAIAISLALIMSIALVTFNPFDAFAEDTVGDFFFPTPSVVVDEETGTAVVDEDGNVVVVHPEQDNNEDNNENNNENADENEGDGEDNGDENDEDDNLSNIDLGDLDTLTPEVGANEDGNIVVSHPNGETFVIEQEVPVFPPLPNQNAPVAPAGGFLPMASSRFLVEADIAITPATGATLTDLTDGIFMLEIDANFSPLNVIEHIGGRIMTLTIDIPNGSTATAVLAQPSNTIADVQIPDTGILRFEVANHGLAAAFNATAAADIIQLPAGDSSLTITVTDVNGDVETIISITNNATDEINPLPGTFAITPSIDIFGDSASVDGATITIPDDFSEFDEDNNILGRLMTITHTHASETYNITYLLNDNPASLDFSGTVDGNNFVGSHVFEVANHGFAGGNPTQLSNDTANNANVHVLTILVSQQATPPTPFGVYTYHITNLAEDDDNPPEPPSNDATLETLTLGGGFAGLSFTPPFSADVFDYEVTIPVTFTLPALLSVTALPNDEDATITVTLGTTDVEINPSGVIVFPTDGFVAGSTNVLTIRVTAANGDFEDYTITFFVGEPANPDATLTGITVTGLVLEPLFDATAAIQVYSVDISQEFIAPINDVYVNVIQADVVFSVVTATFNGNAVPNGNITHSTVQDSPTVIRIPAGFFQYEQNNPLVITVSNGTATPQIYTLNFLYGDVVLNNDNTLTDITFGGGLTGLSLDPEFSSGETIYTVEIAENFELPANLLLNFVQGNAAARVTATLRTSDLTTDSDLTVAAGVITIPTVSFVAGSTNVVTITVIAEDGTPQSYEITFTVAGGGLIPILPPDIDWEDITIGYWNDDTNAYVPVPNFTFDEEVFEYNITIPAGFGVGHALDFATIIRTANTNITMRLDGELVTVHRMNPPTGAGDWFWASFDTTGDGLPEMGNMAYYRLPAGNSTVVVTVAGTPYTFNITNNAADGGNGGNGGEGGNGGGTPGPGPGVTPSPGPGVSGQPPVVYPHQVTRAWRTRPSTRRVTTATITTDANVDVNLNIGNDSVASVTINLPSRINTRGIATLNVTDAAINQAITAVRTAARDATENVTSFIVIVEAAGNDVNGINSTVHVNALRRLADANATLQVVTDNILVELDPVALRALSAETRGNLRLNVAPPISLNVTFRNAVGANPAFSFGISAATSGTVRNLTDGAITLGIASNAPGLNVSTFTNNQLTTLESTFVDGFYRFNGFNGVFGLSN
ncbi:MAG: hypothetical protein FWG64_06180 [Firmicutes bacterium]|nr:hypothetical protein [Bacillota bacterium]